jgi:predicted dehydrogenase
MASNAKVAVDLDQILKDPDINIVIVSTTNDHLSRLSIMAANAKKHVLVEKPAGRNVKEITAIADAARKNGVIVKVGFNHRFHPALLKAKEIVASGILGDLMFLRGRYGHGGRLGYEKEWRANPEMSGGGELIDQGVHLIDLSRMFLGDFTRVEGYAGTYFWDMRVDDNAFMQLRTKDDRVAWLHVSCTEWKNMFSFEIYGKYGKLQIDGLGGSYGTEKLTCYKMLPQMGPPETEVWEYPSPDRSWELEFKDFINAIEKKRQPEGNIMDAIKALEIVKKIYEVSK